MGGAQGQLFGDGGAATPRRRRPFAPTEPTAPGEPLPDGALVVRVLPDVRTLGQVFDYLVLPGHGPVGVGSIVEVDLGSRRVRGWVVDVGVEAPAQTRLRPIRRVRSAGPPPDVVALTHWGAWRFAGARSALLTTASPGVRVNPAISGGLPDPGIPDTGIPDQAGSDPAAAERQLGVALGLDATGVFTRPVSVLRCPPLWDATPVLAAAASLGPIVVVAPTVSVASKALGSLAAAGHRVVSTPGGWEAARTGGVSVVGTRGAVWAPCAQLAAVVVLDEHDEAHHQQHTPTWHSRTVAIERAARAGVPCLLVSPTPTLEALDAGVLVAPGRAAERSGWPTVEVVDQRYADPLLPGLLSERLAEVVREGGSVLCVLNRRGRARMLACGGCNEVVRCESCGSVVAQESGGDLHCGACGARRPPVCTGCGRTSLRVVRRGVSRLRDDLAALAGEPVAEVTADGSGAVPTERLVVGTEAALHQGRRYDTIAFCDFDQELLAPRYRAGEQALALVVRALGATTPPAVRPDALAGLPAVVVQTSVPDHPAVVAAATGDPETFSAAERVRRNDLRWPPASSMALISGDAAQAFIAAVDQPADLEVLGPVDDRWVLRAPTTGVLCDVLGATERPPGRLRIEVDPLRL